MNSVLRKENLTFIWNNFYWYAIVFMYYFFYFPDHHLLCHKVYHLCLHQENMQVLNHCKGTQHCILSSFSYFIKAILSQIILFDLINIICIYIYIKFLGSEGIFLFSYVNNVVLGIDKSDLIIAVMAWQCRLEGNIWYVQLNNNHWSP